MIGLVFFPTGPETVFGRDTSPEAEAFSEMGGKVAESNESSRATEASVRGFWKAYRELTGL